MARQYLIPEVGYINETGSRDYLVPGSAYVIESLPLPDKWHPQQSRPVFRLEGLRDHRSAEPVFVTAAPAAAPTGWLASGPDIAPRRPSVAHMAPPGGWAQAAFTERVSIDRWNRDTERPRFDARRQQTTFEWSSFNPLPLASPVFIDKWHPHPNQPLFQRENRFWFTPPAWTETKFVEQVSADRWHPEIQRPRFDATRSQHIHPALFWSYVVAVVVSGPPIRLQPISAAALGFQTVNGLPRSIDGTANASPRTLRTIQ